MELINRFCNIIRCRTNENKKSFEVLFNNSLYGNSFSILRLELDSMVRVIYLLNLTNIEERKKLIEKTLNEEKWSLINSNEKNQKSNDKDMIDISNNLNGWTKSVYKFGCAFIHLSRFHEYLTEDPFERLTENEKNEIIEHIQYYHGLTLNQNSTLTDIIPILPRVIDKITSNLENSIQSLENNENNH